MGERDREEIFTEEQKAIIQDMISEAVKMAVDTALAEAMSTQGKLASESAAHAMLQEITRNRKERYDKRLRNTKLLLRNYRMLKKHIAEAVYDGRDRERPEAESAYDLMNGLAGDKHYIESIRKSVRRTRIIMSHVDSMLAVYKAYCEQSGKPEAPRHYRVIEGLYLLEEARNPQDIADAECVDKRTIYKDVDAAAEILTPLFFGVDGIKTDF